MKRPVGAGARLLAVGGGKNNGGGFFRSRKDFDVSVRAQLGDAVADGIQRDLRLRDHPRQLSESEQAQLQAALTPILRDMRATGAVLPDILPEARFDRGEEFVCAWITDGDGMGCGIRICVTTPLASQVWDLAGQLVEWANDIQVGRRTPWPQCPDHAGTHPLWPDIEAGSAVWKCENSDRIVCRIGALPGSEPEWEATT
jgi:hypothetical protein